MQVTSNTGPIIALAKISCLSILKTMFSEILIPPVVYRELLGKSGTEWEEIESALNDFIKVMEPDHSDNATELAIANLDEGERQTIKLAANLRGNVLLLIDDKAGREAASRLNIPITGTIGILLLAKEKGRLTDVTLLIDKLRNSGYWFSDELIEIAKKLAKEDL
jgi:predicted nucleic acid-binding protein